MQFVRRIGFYAPWDYSFVQSIEPSIEYMELFAVVAATLTWLHRFRDKRIQLHCDNQSMVNMLNSMSSSCKNCMVLIRKIMLCCLLNNVRLSAVYISMKNNFLADALSHLQFKRFFNLAPKNVSKTPTELPQENWPMQKNMGVLI